MQDCEECRNTARGIAIIFGIILSVLVLSYLAYLNRTRIRACLIVMSMLRRTITMARLKIVLSTFQVGSMRYEPRPSPQPDPTQPSPCSTFQVGTRYEPRPQPQPRS